MTKLRQELSAYGLIMIVIGTLIGSGIYLMPSMVAGHLSSPYLIFLAWTVGGIISLTGALCFAELGSMFPKTGGVYVYLKEAYGPLAGFLFGWCTFTVILTGVIAALAIACSNYISFILPMGAAAKNLTAILIIVLLTIINIFRVKVAEIFTNIFTGVKLISISFVILAGFIWGSADTLKQSLTSSTSAASPLNVASAFGLALIGIMWSFGGFQHVTYLSGEAKNPKKDIPRAIVTGVLVVIVVYILANWSYMRLMPLQAIAKSESIAADAISTAIPFGGLAIAVIIILSILATTFLYLLSAPRIYFAMANDGLFFKTMTKVHPRHRTPANAIIIQSLWAILLILVWGSFEAVVTYLVFVGWTFVMISALSVVVLRFKRPDAARPYKAFGYPVTPIIFALTLFLFVLNILVHNPIQSGAGVALLLAGLPVYYYFQRKKRTARIQMAAVRAESESIV